MRKYYFFQVVFFTVFFWFINISLVNAQYSPSITPQPILSSDQSTSGYYPSPTITNTPSITTYNYTYDTVNTVIPTPTINLSSNNSINTSSFYSSTSSITPSVSGVNPYNNVTKQFCTYSKEEMKIKMAEGYSITMVCHNTDDDTYRYDATNCKYVQGSMCDGSTKFFSYNSQGGQVFSHDGVPVTAVIPANIWLAEQAIWRDARIRLFVQSCRGSVSRILATYPSIPYDAKTIRYFSGALTDCDKYINQRNNDKLEMAIEITADWATRARRATNDPALVDVADPTFRTKVYSMLIAIAEYHMTLIPIMGGFN